MKRRLISLALLIGLLLSAVSCAQPQPNEQNTQDSTEITEQATAAEGKTTATAEESSTETETQEEVVMKEPRNVGDRYFIYRIWNFTPMTQKQFETIVDAAAETGFNAVKVHIPWSRVESTTAGKYDFRHLIP